MGCEVSSLIDSKRTKKYKSNRDPLLLLCSSMSGQPGTHGRFSKIMVPLWVLQRRRPG